MQFRELTDRYQLQKILKSTRFGTVLRATDIPSGKTVAVKLVTAGPGLTAGAAEFEKLAAALADLGHPNLPAVLDSGFTSDGSAFLVLELVAGRSLDTLAGAPPARLLSLVSQALNGLEALAVQSLAHLNVSPDNVFVVPAAGGERVVLLGLGTAVFRPREPGAAAVENARFLAPEVTAGEPAGWRSDLYSLALTTCQALGATVGFGEAPVVQLPLAVSFELESDEALRQTLERSLRQRPNERPTLRDLRQALRLAIGSGAAVSPLREPAADGPEPIRSLPGGPLSPLLAIPDAWKPAANAQATSPPTDFLLPDPLPSEEAAPQEPDEVLSAVDDEILNALLSVPPPPPRPAGSAAESAETGKAASGAAPVRPVPSRSAPFFRRPAVLGAVAGTVVVLGALAAWWLLLRPQPQPVAPPPPPPPIALVKPPSRPPVERLDEARLSLVQGDDLKARRVLRSIPFGEQGLLSPAGCRELSAIEETLALAAQERLPSDLATGLKAGNLELLQAAVEAGTGQEAGLPAAVRADFDRARGIVDAYEQARNAAKRGDHTQVLERYATLAALLPQAADPEDLRGKAAQALEAESETMVQGARYADALARLGPIQRTWPDRIGLAERIARYQTYQGDEKKQEGILAALPALESRRKPWDALQMLTDVEPTPHLAPRFAEARKRLEGLLARLDKQPPQIVLRDGYLLEYARGTVAELSFRVTDDYQVKEVKLMARPQGGKFQDLPLETSRTGYSTVRIDPRFHRNGTVELYVLATDLSGHEGAFGSPDKPLQLKRKQGFERILR
ncbi:MAG TPA: protein kinase [Thermoanaerobaculia bacterium]|nr:protein kinase [Thermoanaerobaculia bacterium]